MEVGQAGNTVPAHFLVRKDGLYSKRLFSCFTINLEKEINPTTAPEEA